LQGPQQTVLLTYILYIGALVGWWLLYAGTTADSTAYLYTVYRSLLAGGCCMQGPQQTVLLTYILYIGACRQVAVICRDHGRQLLLPMYRNLCTEVVNTDRFIL
jgi:hypothetical protein